MTLTEKLRENPWMVATFVLGIALIIMLSVDFATRPQENERVLTNEQKMICGKIQYTPAWLNSNYSIIGYGPVKNTKVQELIDNEIIFAYLSTCPHCKAQIEKFDNWEKYQESGYAVRCG